VTKGAFAGAEALLALNPIQRAQQKSKEREHVRENILLNGLYTTHQKQYLRLKLSVYFVVVDSIPLLKRGDAESGLSSMRTRVKLDGVDWHNAPERRRHAY